MLERSAMILPMTGRRLHPAKLATVEHSHSNIDPIAVARFGSSRIVYLQYLRAIAALAVLLFHSSYYLASMRGEAGPLKIFGPWFGDFGVTLFFAISGYLMATLAKRSAPATFLAHRLVRIYPIYWIVTAFCLALRCLFNDEVQFDPLAFLLVPGSQHFYPLAVEWTLPFELTFYLIIFFVILSRVQRLLPMLAAAWVVGIVAIHLVAPGIQRVHGQFPTLFYIPLAEKSLAFAAGLMVPFALRWRMIGPAAPIVALALLVGSEVVPRLQPWLVDSGCVLLVATAALSRPAWRGEKTDLGAALGDWSFALYLCHVTIIIYLYRFAPSASPPAALWLAAVGAPLCGAVLLGQFDVALYVGLKRRMDRWRPLARYTVAAMFITMMVGLGAVAELNQIHLRRVAAMGDAVGKHIQTAGAATLSAVQKAANGMALTYSDALRSHIEMLKRDPFGTLVAQGWILDVDRQSDRMAVLAFCNGRFSGASVPQIARADVLAAFGVQGAPLLPGFALQMSLACQDDATLVLLAVSADGRYAFIALPMQKNKIQ